MMDQPLPVDSAVRDLLTVVIPTRNRPDLLALCLRSVFEKQTCRLRVIVSDNSHLSSPEIEPLRSRYSFEYVRQSGTLSIVEHFNACLAMARTRWVLLLHDDDELYPECLTHLGPYLAQHSDVGIIVGGVERIDGGGNIVGRWVHANPGSYRGEAAVLALGLGVNRYPYAPSTILCVSEVHRQGGYQNASALPLPADLTLDLTLAYLHGVAFVPEVIGRYREGHAQQSQVSSPQKIHDWLSFMVEMAERVGESGCPEPTVRKLVDYWVWSFLPWMADVWWETDRNFVYELGDRCLRLSPEPGEWQHRIRRDYPFLFWRPRWCAWPLFRIRRKVASLSGRDVRAWYSLGTNAPRRLDVLSELKFLLMEDAPRNRQSRNRNKRRPE
jgi:glycosyltransferase involved in cell wall biosynthesis